MQINPVPDIKALPESTTHLTLAWSDEIPAQFAFLAELGILPHLKYLTLRGATLTDEQFISLVDALYARRGMSADVSLTGCSRQRIFEDRGLARMRALVDEGRRIRVVISDSAYSEVVLVDSLPCRIDNAHDERGFGDWMSFSLVAVILRPRNRCDTPPSRGTQNFSASEFFSSADLRFGVVQKDREPGSLRNVIDSVDLVHQCPSAGIEAAVGTKTKWSITVVITQAAAAPMPTPRLYGIIKHHASKQLALGSSGMVPAQWQCGGHEQPRDHGIRNVRHRVPVREFRVTADATDVFLFGMENSLTGTRCPTFLIPWSLVNSGTNMASGSTAANMYPGSEGCRRGVWRGVPGAARRGGRCDVIMWRGKAGVAWRGEVCQVLRVAGVRVRHGRARSGRGEARVRARRLQMSDDGPVGRDWRAGVAGVAALRGGLGGDRSSSSQTMRLISRDESTARSTESIGLTVYRVYLVVYPVYRVYLVYLSEWQELKRGELILTFPPTFSKLNRNRIPWRRSSKHVGTLAGCGHESTVRLGTTPHIVYTTLAYSILQRRCKTYNIFLTIQSTNSNYSETEIQI
ncbi:hypothetical protein FB45DRAFT_865798 [Roridomyces roridus]|uniref:Uncharacterized protein n=1 Tax=Roridomyces roridus TaxID=1738132 RepID=A0AAD7FRP2_9AGAR|nr:hypothetical protein FB45DRAFT_865798 [Roridomyces roridus]